MVKTLRTGQVAAAAGVNVETLRYYERRGILAEPARLDSGYREYPPNTVAIVRFIKRAQDLGFTLGEIQELLALRDDHSRTCDEVRGAARAKLAEIEAKLEQLDAMRGALLTLVDSCVPGASTYECPIIEALDNRESSA